LDKLKYQIIEKKTSHKFIILTYARWCIEKHM
jgi:hypothetical protein